MTPIGAVVAGLIAGCAGTAAMDAFRYLQYRRDGGAARPLEWEFGGVRGWDDVSAPGQVGRRVVEGLLQKPLPAEAAAPTNNIVHWGYGASWGAVFGLIAGSMRSVPLTLGPVFGTAVSLNGYVVLPLLGLYKPIWQYDPKTLIKDLSGHLAYGTATAVAFRVLRAIA